MDRLTKKYAGGYGLVKVKDNEQDLESPYPNTLRACFESWQRLGAYEDTGLTPAEVEALKSERDRFKARAEAAEKDITALARRAIDGFQDSKFITPCRWCAEREQCDLLTTGANTCFKWRGPQEGANNA